ncbi:MAG: SMC family ATPase, partial [Bifidobacteriaceae bacterium]|nr:SMC family ATPase [Bifidobacteriaceae bacterium]
MRIHSLSFAGIGPFAGQQRIDFGALSASGLFLLEGPTGAGKSTVIDAIVFALYGTLADDSADKHRLRSDYCDPAAASYVDLVFEVASGVYRIRRTPQHRRPKHRGEGTTEVNSTARLWRLTSPGDTVGELVSGNVAEASAQVAGIVGLSREQFVQTVVLPQGKFAAFLQAGTDQRRSLLQRIFGTEIYEAVLGELQTRRKAAARRLERLVAEVSQAVRGLAAMARLPQPEAAELDQAAGQLGAGGPGEPVVALAEAASARLAEAAAIADQLAAAAGKASSQAAAASAEAAAAAAAAVTRDQLTRRGAELEGGANQRESTRQRLEAARRSAGLAPIVAAEEAADRTWRAARQAVEARGLPLAGLDAAALQAALDQAALAEAESAKRVAAAHLLAAARQAEREAELAAEAAREALAKATAALAQASGRAERSARERPGLLAQAEALAQLEANTKAHAKAAAALPGALKRREAAKAAFDQAQSTEVGLRNARLAGIAGEMAAGLLQGQPCPVCGSAEHPAPAALEANHVTFQDVKQAEAARAAAAAAYEAASREAAEAQARVRELAALTSGATPAEASQRLAAAAAQLAELGGVDQLAAALDQAKQVADAARPAVEVAEAALRAAHDSATRLDQQSSGESVPAAQEALAKAQRAKQKARLDLEAARRLAEAGKAAQAARDQAERALAEARFESREAARAARIAPAEAERLEQELTAAAAELLSVKQRLADPALAAAEAAPAAAQAKAEAAALAAAQTQQREREATSAQALARRAAEQTAEALDLTRQAVAALAQARQQAAPLIRLADLAAAGTANLRGVDLPTYVLIRRFEEVVAAANERLGPMSSGRYQLEHSEAKEAARQRRTGLALRVRDNLTGEARAPRTLSGGETFYVSLSLALGLADVVTAEAGGTALETLFVDEGFGSLDGESLEAVLSQLARLRQGGRVVGLVSHVETLKQAIPDRIEVRRAPQGG